MFELITFPWSNLSDDDFEELCKDILRAEGFENVQRLSGPGSGDMGRDIHAEESFLSLTGTTIQQKIFLFNLKIIMAQKRQLVQMI